MDMKEILHEFPSEIWFTYGINSKTKWCEGER